MKVHLKLPIPTAGRVSYEDSIIYGLFIAHSCRNKAWSWRSFRIKSL